MLLFRAIARDLLSLLVLRSLEYGLSRSEASSQTGEVGEVIDLLKKLSRSEASSQTQSVFSLSRFGLAPLGGERRTDNG